MKEYDFTTKQNGNFMQIPTLQRSLSLGARLFHTSPQVLGRVWTALDLPRYVGQTNLDNTRTGRIKQAVYGVTTTEGTCIFKNSLKGRLRIYSSTYHGKASPPMHQLRAAYSDSDPEYRALIFKDTRATYVYPTPLDFAPHNETPPLIKKVTSVVLACGEEKELEFSERQAPNLPLPFLEEIQRLIQKAS